MKAYVCDYVFANHSYRCHATFFQLACFLSLWSYCVINKSRGIETRCSRTLEVQGVHEPYMQL